MLQVLIQTHGRDVVTTCSIDCKHCGKRGIQDEAHPARFGGFFCDCCYLDHVLQRLGIVLILIFLGWLADLVFQSNVPF
jgi:hypothetical protein